MAYEPKPGEGALFKNEHKTADNHPGAKGYIVAHRDIKKGERLELASWTRDSAKGKFQSLKMSDPRQRRPAENGYDGDDGHTAAQNDDDYIPGI